LTKQFDVITAGPVFLDIVMSGFTDLPKFGEEAECAQLQYEAGGGAAITACGLAKLGCKTALLAVVGDSDSVWFRRRLESFGVDLSYLRLRENESTALTVSASTRLDRAYFTYPGANKLLPELFADPIIRHALRQARHAHIANAIAPDTLIELSNELRRADTTLSLDVGWRETWLRDEDIWPALRAVDLFFPNEREAALLTGQSEPEAILQTFADAGVSTVALKLGANGAALLYAGKRYFAAPHQVAPLDTTGAGDCFNAGFLFAWLQGKVPAECLRVANICGALSTQALGGVAAFPTIEQLAI
jgi:sugar/nucleoside kinase (ribokinase family)